MARLVRGQELGPRDRPEFSLSGCDLVFNETNVPLPDVAPSSGVTRGRPRSNGLLRAPPGRLRARALPPRRQRPPIRWPQRRPRRPRRGAARRTHPRSCSPPRPRVRSQRLRIVAVLSPPPLRGVEEARRAGGRRQGGTPSWDDDVGLPAMQRFSRHVDQVASSKRRANMQLLETRRAGTRKPRSVSVAEAITLLRRRMDAGTCHPDCRRTRPFESLHARS